MLDNNRSIIEIFVRSKMADSGPPLGTILGNLGVNAVKFCKEFNDFTNDLPNYFFLKVKIIITDDRNFSFFVSLPTLGFFLGLLKFTRVVKILGKGVTEHCIFLKYVVQLAYLKFPSLPIKESFPI